MRGNGIVKKRDPIRNIKNCRKTAGFSLTEIAIVFAAAAAVIVAVMAGGALVQRAKFSVVYDDIARFARAADVFQRKYGALPGDLASNVSGDTTTNDKLPGAIIANSATAGNGVIDTAEEARLFWQQLSAAGLLDTKYSGSTSSNIPGKDIPVGPIDGTGYSIIPDSNGTITIRLSRYSNSSTSLSVFTPADAQAIDKKADDGKPRSVTSKIRGVSGSDAPVGKECYTGTGESATYNINVNVASCMLDFALNPHISVTGDDAISCGQLGAVRQSSRRSCPVGYPGKILETCTPQGWITTRVTCKAVTCPGEKDYAYKETRLEACPSHYSGSGITRTCSVSGAWVNSSEDCTADTEACSIEGAGRVLSCPEGQKGRVMQTCTSGSWATNSDSCGVVQCGGTDNLGATKDVASGTPNCGTNYKCATTNVDEACTGKTGITQACTMTGAGVGAWEAVADTCVPDYSNLNSVLGTCDSGSVGNEADMGCPSDQEGTNKFKCNGTDWVPEGSTCRPLSCGNSPVGTMEVSTRAFCPDQLEGRVYEVCSICQSGEPCETNGNLGKAVWKLNFSNCTLECSGSADNAGNAVWPNAFSNTTDIRSASCLSGYYGVAVRNCEEVAQSGLMPLHGRWSVPTKNCFKPPFDVTGLQLWIDASDPYNLVKDDQSVPSDGDTIAGWLDQSQANNDLSSSGTNEPRYIANQLNGHGVVRFANGGYIDDYMYTSGNVDLTSGYSVFWVGKNRTHRDYSGILSIRANPSVDANMELYYQAGSTGSGNLVALADRQAGAGAYRYIQATDVAPVVNSYAINSVIVDDTISSPCQSGTYAGTSGGKIYVNGYLQTLDLCGNTGGATSLLPTTANPFYIGLGYGHSGYSLALSTLDGDIAEMLVYNTVFSSLKRRQVEEYLSDKWGIPIAKKFEEIDGITLWLDAQNPNGDDSAGTSGALATWADTGPFRHDAAQSTSTYQPNFVASGINQKASISFASDYYVLTSPSGSGALDTYPFRTGNTPYSLFAVVEPTTVSGYHRFFGTVYLTGSTYYKQNNIFGQSSGVALDLWPGDNAYTGTVIENNTPYILTFTYDESNNVGRKIYVNGLPQGRSGLTDRNGFNRPSPTYIGSEQATSNPWAGYLGEIMVYDKLVSEDDRKAIEAYLSAKWAIPLEWSPNDISGLKMWHDGSVYGGYVYSPSAQQSVCGYTHNTMSYWADMSGNCNFAEINTTVTTHPTAGTLDGKSVVSFDKPKVQSLYMGSSIGAQEQEIVDLGNASHTFFNVAYADRDVPMSLYTWECNLGAGCYDGPAVYVDAAGLLKTANSNGDGIDLSNKTDMRNNVFLLTEWSDKYSRRYYLNGEKTADFAVNSFIASDAFRIGLNYYSGLVCNSCSWDGKMAEQILYNRALSDSERKRVESYLSAKWTLGKIWSPDDISGLELWLDADDASTFTLSGNQVSKWYNKAQNQSVGYVTGNANDTLVSNSLNAKPVVHLSGSGSYLYSNAAMDPETIFLVHRSIASTSGNNYLFDFRSGIANSYFINRSSGIDSYMGSVWSTYPMYINGKIRWMDNSNTDAPVFSGNYQISVFYGATSGTNAMYLGSRYSIGEYMQGDIAEVVSYNTHLKTADRVLVEDYLSKKWGIAVSTPNLDSPVYTTSGLQIWLDATDSATLSQRPVDSGKISAITNKNNDYYTNWYPAIQSTNSQMPSYSATALNGLPGWTDAANGGLVVLDQVIDKYFTLFTVGQFVDGAHGMFIEHSINSNSYPGFYFYGYGHSPLSMRYSSTNAVSAAANDNWQGTAVGVFTAYGDGSVIGYYKNTSFPTSQAPMGVANSSDIPDPGSVIRDNLYIGYRQNLGVTTTGSFGEVALYDRYLGDSSRKVIEDYLVGKWISAADTTVATDSADSSSGLTLWIDANDTSTMKDTGYASISDGATVQMITDKKGFGTQYAFSASSTGPTYVAASQNNKGVMRFGGTNDMTLFRNNATPPTTRADPVEIVESASASEVNDYTIFSAFKASAIDDNSYILPSNNALYGSSDSNNNILSVLRNNPSRVVGAQLVNSTSLAASQDINLDTFYVSSQYLENGYFYFDLDGANIAKILSVDIPATRSWHLGSFYLGSAGSIKFKGDIGEFIVYSKALTQAHREAVEAYLGGKWGVTMTYGDDSSSSNQSPSSVTGLVLWLDASDNTTVLSLDNCTGEVVVNGGGTGCWKDKSGNNYNFIQADVSHQPTYQTAGLAGKNIMHFTAANTNYMSSAHASLGPNFSLYSPFTIMAAVRLTTLDDKNSLIGNNSIAPYNGEYLLNVGSSDGKMYLSRYEGGSVSSSFSLSAGQAYIATALYDGSVEKLYDGISLTDSASATSAYPSTLATLLGGVYTYVSGNNTYVVNNTLDADVAEVLIYDKALSDEERVSLYNYLADKWHIGVDASTVPAAQTGLQLWFDASDDDTVNGTGIPSNNDAIIKWDDKSSNAKQAVQFASSGSSGVFYSTTGMGGKPAMLFDGIPLQVSGSSSMDVTNNATWFVVLKVNSGTYESGPSSILAKGTTGSYVTNFALGLTPTDSGGTNGDLYFGLPNSSTPTTLTTFTHNLSVFDRDTPYMLTYRYTNGSPGTMDIFKKGGSQGASQALGISLTNTALANATTYDLNGKNIMIGSRVLDGSGSANSYESTSVSESNFKGGISELIMYNEALGDAERQEVESYLDAKWNITQVPAETSTGMTLWLDASDASTINGGSVSSDASVTSWADKSGSGHDFANVDGTAPIFVSDVAALNNKPAIRFNNNGALRTTATLADMINTTGSDSFTSFFVFRPLSVDTDTANLWQDDAVIMDSQSGGTGGYWGLALRSSGSVYGYGYSAGAKYSSSTFTPSQAYVATYYKDGTKLYLKINGQTGAASADITDIDNTTYPLRIGTGRDSYYEGDVGEIIIYNKLLTLSERVKIENYLATKWNVGNAFSAVNTDPSAIAGLSFWIDANDATTINGGSVSNGQAVTAMADKSSNATNMDLTSTSGPIYRTGSPYASPSGLPVLDFVAASNHRLNTAAVPYTAMVSSNQGTVFLTTNVQTANSGFVFDWQSATTNRFAAVLAHSNGNTYFNFGDASGAGSISTTTPSNVVQNWHQITYLRKNLEGSIYMDGSLVLNASMTDPLDASTQILSIGNYQAGGYGYDGRIGEMLIYNITLSDVDRIKIQNYLMAKWGIN